MNFKLISWSNDDFSTDVKISVLSENQSSKDIQIIMPKNSVMKEHKAPFDITVQVLKGCIDFGIDDKRLRLNELDMIAVLANVPHSLMANEDSIIRLNLSKKDDVSRVSKILNL